MRPPFWLGCGVAAIAIVLIVLSIRNNAGGVVQGANVPQSTKPLPPLASDPISDADYQIYNDVMDYLKSDYSRPEAEILGEIAPSYGMTAVELERFITGAMAAAHERDRLSSNDQPLEDDGFGGIGIQLSKVVNGSSCTLTYLIQPSYDVDSTIRQTFHTVGNFIRRGGGNQYKSIKYFGKMAGSDGEENTVVSFSLESELVQQLYGQTVLSGDLANHLSDLWVSPNII